MVKLQNLKLVDNQQKMCIQLDTLQTKVVCLINVFQISFKWVWSLSKILSLIWPYSHYTRFCFRLSRNFFSSHRSCWKKKPNTTVWRLNSLRCSNLCYENSERWCFRATFEDSTRVLYHTRLHIYRDYNCFWNVAF